MILVVSSPSPAHRPFEHERDRLGGEAVRADASVPINLPEHRSAVDSATSSQRLSALTAAWSGRPPERPVGKRVLDRCAHLAGTSLGMACLHAADVLRSCSNDDDDDVKNSDGHEGPLGASRATTSPRTPCSLAGHHLRGVESTLRCEGLGLSLGCCVALDHLVRVPSGGLFRYVSLPPFRRYRIAKPRR